MTPFLLRNCLTLALTSGVISAAYAQSGTPAAGPPPAAPATEATVAPAAAATSLLAPAQLKDSKYRSYLAQRYATDKEARAIMHLFARKQRGGSLWLATGITSIGIIAFQTGTTTTDSGTTTFTVTPLGYGLLVGLFGGVGIGKLARFNNANLYRALAAHDQGGPLPMLVKKKLKDKDYR